MLCSILFAITHEIKQDGTGDFSTIQSGIEASTHSDTVLVYPGRYFENINFLEKSITVTSLYSINQQDSLIAQTIIDGNHQGRCVTISNCESAAIIGFTIQNGYAFESGWTGSLGGGIMIEYGANTLIANCLIKENFANGGGGVSVFYSQNIYFKGNTIISNRGIFYGGGISVAGNELNLEFNNVYLNNIYLNYAPTGSEINIPFLQNPVEIVLDTFIVANPDYFHITCPDTLYTFSCLNSAIEEIDQDLYVSPDGDDNNSGLTPQEPLQTLAWAQTIIKRNDSNPHTIHLAEGTYSPSLNNQILPLNVKHGVLFKGVSQELTILDAEEETSFFNQYFRDQSEFAKLALKDLKMINGAENGSPSNGGIKIYQADLHLTNVTIENCNGHSGGTIQTSNGYCNLENVIMNNNTGFKALSLGIEYNCPNPVRNVRIANSRFINNSNSIYDPDFTDGGAIRIGGHSNIPGDYYAEILNCEFISNYNASDFFGIGGSSAVSFDHLDLVNVINCTFSDNTLLNNAGCTIAVEFSELNFINNIVYGNEGLSIRLYEEGDVNIAHSLLEGSTYNIDQYHPDTEINWLDGNFEEFTDPGFCGENNNYPFYSLEADSPCIDAGTLDLLEGIELPEYDLAGNPRVYGEAIDMGAYEFQGESQAAEPEEVTIPKETKISNYPNPFNPSTTIKLNLAESGKIILSIYNTKGQKIITLLNKEMYAGQYDIIWNGVNENNFPVSSGVYLYKVKTRNQESVNRMILLK